MKHLLALALSAIMMTGTASALFADGSGQFTGASNHVTTGGVTVTKNADGTATVTFANDFFFDGAPDPWVGFGKNGKFVQSTNLGKLKGLTGGQSYAVPASINVDDFNEVYVFCVRFNVPLGVAQIN